MVSVSTGPFVQNLHRVVTPPVYRWGEKCWSSFCPLFQDPRSPAFTGAVDKHTPTPYTPPDTADPNTH